MKKGLLILCLLASTGGSAQISQTFKNVTINDTLKTSADSLLLIRAHLTPTSDSLFDIGEDSSRWSVGYFNIINTNTLAGVTSASIVSSITGWAQYVDTIYTSAAPFTVLSGVTDTLENGAHEVNLSQLPDDSPSGFYDSLTKLITPTNVGDSYILSIRFKAKTTGPTSAYFDIALEIGGALGVVSQKTELFSKGAGIEQSFNTGFNVFTLDTFVTNGGVILITPSGGNVTIYDISYVIIRTHKAR